MTSARTFDPWIGAKYLDGIRGVKVLIVGESHHGGPGCDYKEFTTKVIRDEALGLNGHPRRAYFTKIMRLLMGAQHPADADSCAAFWESVAFYNFVQTALDKPRERPTDEQWGTGPLPFVATVQELSPNYTVILGLELERWIPADFKGFKRTTLHPSAYGFSYGDSPRLINEDIDKIKA